MKKRYGWILVFGFAVLATACMIFYFSSQDGLTSSDTSVWAVKLVLRVLRPDYEALGAAEKARLIKAYQLAVRKAAHFIEFALLGAFLCFLFYALRIRRKAALSWLAGTLYAFTDEWHQMFVGQRSPAWQDVVIDSGGVLFGVLLALAFLYLHFRRRAKKRNSSEN